jgi:hypothetical protein
MAAVARVLREKLGEDALGGLQALVDDAGRRWKEDVLVLVAERFDRRLGEEIGALRLDMAKEFAAVRVDTAKEFAAVRVEMAAMRTDLRSELAAMGTDLRSELAATRFSILKWSFLFWVGQLAAMTGIMALLLRTIVPR